MFTLLLKVNRLLSDISKIAKPY